MATAFNSVRRPLKKQKIASFTNPVICNLEFDGIIPLQISGKLASELLKYILYNRGQIPMQYDALCNNVIREQNSKNESETRASLFRRQRCYKKVQETIHAVEEILNKFASVFTNSVENTSDIKEILVILGATPFSPKNTFNIHLPTVFPTTENDKQSLSLRQCLVQVFRKMVITDDLSSLPDLRVTNTYVFVKMSRYGVNDWFLPKPEYRPSSRGKWVHFLMKNKSSRALTIVSELLSAGNQQTKPHISEEKELNSEIRSFTIYSDSPHPKHLPHQSQSFQPCFQDKSEECSSDAMNSEVQELVEPMTSLTINEQCLTTQLQDEYIWYQAPVVIKGFKDWITVHQNLSEIWA